jgi:fermentation-respiration switch protein FrsA (DUF1100 family)
MIIHSADDEMVSFARQYGLFEEIYGNDPRFTFIRYEDRGHNMLFQSGDSLDAELMNRIVTFYDSYAS